MNSFGNGGVRIPVITSTKVAETVEGQTRSIVIEPAHHCYTGYDIGRDYCANSSHSEFRPSRAEVDPNMTDVRAATTPNGETLGLTVMTTGTTDVRLLGYPLGGPSRTYRHGPRRVAVSSGRAGVFVTCRR